MSGWLLIASIVVNVALAINVVYYRWLAESYNLARRQMANVFKLLESEQRGVIERIRNCSSLN